MKIMPSLCLASLLCAVSILPANSQQSGPPLTNPTAAQVLKTWQAPPPEYGPEPYYGMNGAITLDVVERDLDRMKALGFRAVTVQYGYGSERAYLSKEHLEFFRQFVLEAKKRGMRVWIVDDAGYPSGFAGGKFSSEHPELRMQALVVTQKKPVAAGAEIELELTADTVAVTALRARDGELQQVSIVNNHAHFKATDGDWTVMVVEHGFRTSPTRSDTNPKRVKDGSQSLEDYLDPAATAQYLAFTHEAYKRVVGDEFGKTILGFRGDEPDYSIGGLPWTPKFFSIFEQRKGYDIRPYVAAFLQGKDAHLTEQQLRAKADYYDVFAELFRDGFFRPQAEWCAANHLQYQTHLNHEELQLDLARSEGDFFRDMRFVQSPGVDAIWHQIWTDTVSDFPRFASSAAHVYGHQQAFTESFAAYRPAPDVTMTRYILNEQFVRGINLIEVMYFPASTGNGGDRKSFMNDVGFAELMHSSSHLGYLMSQGRPMAEVALLLPAESLWMGSAKADDTFVSIERMLSERQIDFDIVDEDAIGALLPLEHGGFATRSGNRYTTVLVPHAELLPARVVARLQRFAAEGGKVVFVGAAPAWIAAENNLHARAAKVADFSWATIAAGDLPRVPTPPAQPPTAVPEPMVVPAELWSAVEKNLPLSALRLSTPNTQLRFATRKLKDATVYLVFNESALNFAGEVLLHANGKQVEQWNAQDATVTNVQSTSGKQGHQVQLKMAPYEAQVLVVR